MSTLTSTAFFTKKTILSIIILIIVIIIGLILFSFVKQLYNKYFPPKGTPALVAFGKLPDLDLSDDIKVQPGISYSIETITGKLPMVDEIAKVFTIKQPTTSFGDLGNANTIATTAKFAVPAKTVSDGKATYLEKDNPGKTMTIGLVSGDVKVSTDYLTNQQLIASVPSNETDSKKIAHKFFLKLGFDEMEFPEDKIWTIPYKIDSGRLVEAISLSRANLVQINYGRADIDKIPVKYPDFYKSKVNALVSASDVVEANYVSSKIEKYRFSTYPLKGVNAAFEDLKAGNAIFNKKIDGNNFVIRDVTLAYLDTTAPSVYLQPVYVFKSDNNLEAYVRAVKDQYIMAQ